MSDMKSDVLQVSCYKFKSCHIFSGADLENDLYGGIRTSRGGNVANKHSMMFNLYNLYYIYSIIKNKI